MWQQAGTGLTGSGRWATAHCERTLVYPMPLNRTCISGGQDAHSVAAVEALAHKEGVVVQLGNRVVAAQHLQGRHRFTGGK